MSKDYGTEAEIRQELEKLTTKEVIQKLKLWLNRPTEDIGIINTEQLMLERIEQELEVLDKLKHLFIDYFPAVQLKQYTDGSHAIETQDFSSILPISEEEYKKIKEWLENEDKTI